MVLPAKGVVELVDACSRIRNPACELEIVGPVGLQMQERLQAIALERDDGGWLKFSGNLSRPEAIRRIAIADIFALPSYSEGFPISLLEAMACGVAIVATSVGAIPEALTGIDGEAAGVIVPPRDAEALREALGGLLTNPTKRHALGIAARKKCEATYEFSTLVDRLCSVWRQEQVHPHWIRTPTAPESRE
jgi:glycosyltransferase involved in cell wall biosynthesis